MSYNPNNLRPLGTAATRMWAYLNEGADDVFVPGFVSDGVARGMSDMDVIVVQTPLPNSNHPNAGVTGIHTVVAIDKAAGTASLGW